MSNPFKFEDEVNQMITIDRDAKDCPIIWGGAFGIQKFKDFISAWSFDKQPYVIQERAYKIDFEKIDVISIMEQNPALLERMEIFNASSNLSLRRDGDKFLWHFIGSDSEARQDTLGKLETAKFTVKKFWEENPSCKLYKRNESALLWGEYENDSKRWHDDRVGWAILSYPSDGAMKQSKKRVQVDYTVFTENGQTSFVWWKKLKEAKQ